MEGGVKLVLFSRSLLFFVLVHTRKGRGWCVSFDLPHSKGFELQSLWYRHALLSASILHTVVFLLHNELGVFAFQLAVGKVLWHGFLEQ